MRAMILVLLLAGCAGIQGGNAAGGVVRISPIGDTAEMIGLADQHCSRYGRVARINGQMSAFNGSDFMFSCVAP